jgi:hypothetical protein
VNRRPQDLRLRIFLNPSLKPVPPIEAEVQSRKSTKAKAFAARKDSQLRGCQSGKGANGAFSQST